MPIEPGKIKSYTVPVFNINVVKLNPNIIVLKNELVEMWKHIRPCIIRFYKVSKLKSPEEHYLRFLQLYMFLKNENELKQGNQSFEDRYKKAKVTFCVK